MPSYAAFSVVWGDACKEWSCIRCQTFSAAERERCRCCKVERLTLRRFPPRCVNGVGVVKCGEGLTFRHFPSRRVNGVGVVKCGERLTFRRFPPRGVNGVGVVKCGERLAFRRFPSRRVNGVGVVKCGERLTFRRFLPRCVSAPVKCKYVFFHPAFSAAEQNNRQVPDGKGCGVRSLFSLTAPFCLTRF